MTKIPWPNPVYIVFPNPAHNGKPPAVHIKTPGCSGILRDYSAKTLFNIGLGAVLCKSDPSDLSRYPNRTERYGAPVEYDAMPEGLRLCRHCEAALREYLAFCEED